MEIKFIRGDNHQIRFRFTNYDSGIEKMFLTVKCKNKYPRIKKKLNESIFYNDGWYYVEFLPKDTENLECGEMEYDIEIVTGGKKYTVLKDRFVLEEDITTPDCEV